MRNPRSSLSFGAACTALAASIMAVRVPYYAIVATAALVVVLIAWVVTLSRSARGD